MMPTCPGCSGSSPKPSSCKRTCIGGSGKASHMLKAGEHTKREKALLHADL